MRDPLLETANSILTAPATCAVPGAVRTAFGNGDLASELGVENTNHMALDHARSAIVLASAAAGIAPPVDGVTTLIHDDDALRADTRHASALGFTGKLCIHPCQISLGHTRLAPSEDALRQARKVLAAAVGEPVTTLEGRVIDKPIIEHARCLISRHGSSANKPRHAVGES